MKKLITTNPGGLPLSLDFLGFMDAKMDDIAAALSSSVGGPFIGAGNCLLSGCLLSKGVTNWQMSGGYVLYTGELFKVPTIADTGLPNASDPTTGLFWSIVETAVAPSPETYHDLSSNNDTLERIMILTTTNTGFRYEDMPVYGDVIAQMLFGQWNNVTTFFNGWANLAGYQARFKKDRSGLVTLDGTITNPAGTPISSNAFILPVGFRPPLIKVQPVWLNGDQAIALVADAFGQVQPNIPSGGSIDLSGVSFYVN